MTGGGYRVLVVSGPHKDSAYALPLSSSLIVGRRRQAKGGLQLSADEEVSTTHCLIRALADGQVRVEDLGSLNGTRVGAYKKKVVWREELAKDESCAIAAGDCIEVGGSILLLENDPVNQASKVFTGGGKRAASSRALVRFSQTPNTLLADTWTTTPGFVGGRAASSMTTGVRTVSKRRSKSPSNTNVIETPYVASTFAEPPSPVPFHFDAALLSAEPLWSAPFSWKPSKLASAGLMGMALLLLSSCALIFIQAGPPALSLNVASIDAGARVVDVQACEQPTKSWFRSTDKVVAISKQTAVLALSGNVTHGRCFWSPTPWALITLKLSSCVLPEQLRITVLIGEKHPTSSIKMIPEFVDIRTGDGLSLGRFFVKDNVHVVNDVATAKFYFDRHSMSACIPVLSLNITSQIDSKHGACVHRLEVFA